MPNGMDISAIGMSLEKLRLDIASNNISMMNHASSVGQAQAPKSLMVNHGVQLNFEQLISEQNIYHLEDSKLVNLLEGGTKLVHEPQNPLANQDGFVEYPDTNHLYEMMNVLKATRAYEANVKAFNAAKVMHDEALNIGK